MPVPEGILNKPYLSMGLEIYYYAFLDLSVERNPKDAPITLRSMMEYAQCWGYDQDLMERFVWLVSRMDKAYLENL